MQALKRLSHWELSVAATRNRSGLAALTPPLWDFSVDAGLPFPGMRFQDSHLVRVSPQAGYVIETHEHADQFKEREFFTRIMLPFPRINLQILAHPQRSYLPA
jgi:hypothetical protein